MTVSILAHAIYSHTVNAILCSRKHQVPFDMG